MATSNDKFIFCTGVVGRAMGSGKFAAGDIQALTDLAAQAFENTFGSVSAAPTPAPQQPYSPPAAGGGDLPPFQSWAEEQIRMGKKDSPIGKPWGSVTWAEARQLVVDGDPDAVGYLTFLRELQLRGDRYDTANAKIKAKAKAVLASAGK